MGAALFGGRTYGESVSVVPCGNWYIWVGVAPPSNRFTFQPVAYFPMLCACGEKSKVVRACVCVRVLAGGCASTANFIGQGR